MTHPPRYASRAQFETASLRHYRLYARKDWYSGYGMLRFDVFDDNPVTDPMPLSERYADFVSRLSAKMGNMK